MVTAPPFELDQFTWRGRVYTVLPYSDSPAPWSNLETGVKEHGLCWKPAQWKIFSYSDRSFDGQPTTRYRYVYGKTWNDHKATVIGQAMRSMLSGPSSPSARQQQPGRKRGQFKQPAGHFQFYDLPDVVISAVLDLLGSEDKLQLMRTSKESQRCRALLEQISVMDMTHSSALTHWPTWAPRPRVLRIKTRTANHQSALWRQVLDLFSLPSEGRTRTQRSAGEQQVPPAVLELLSSVHELQLQSCAGVFAPDLHLPWAQLLPHCSVLQLDCNTLHLQHVQMLSQFQTMPSLTTLRVRNATAVAVNALLRGPVSGAPSCGSPTPTRDGGSSSGRAGKQSPGGAGRGQVVAGAVTTRFPQLRFVEVFEGVMLSRPWWSVAGPRGCLRAHSCA